MTTRTPAAETRPGNRPGRTDLPRRPGRTDLPRRPDRPGLPRRPDRPGLSAGRAGWVA